MEKSFARREHGQWEGRREIAVFYGGELVGFVTPANRQRKLEQGLVWRPKRNRCQTLQDTTAPGATEHIEASLRVETGGRSERLVKLLKGMEFFCWGIGARGSGLGTLGAGEGRAGVATIAVLGAFSFRSR